MKITSSNVSLIFLGKILKFRGNKGEVVIDPSPEIHDVRKDEYTCIVLQSERYTLAKKIEYIAEFSGQTVVKFAGVNTINDALRFVGYRMYLKTSRAPQDDEQSLSDLIGFQVIDLQEENWGEVCAVRETPQNPLIEVRPPDGGEPLLVPFHEPIVNRIDWQRRILWIDAPPGLKELNR